jgi:hypothetical protein
MTERHGVHRREGQAPALGFAWDARLQSARAKPSQSYRSFGTISYDTTRRSAMAESKLPYINAYGNITKVLEKIQGAATPDRFSQDFLASTLGMKGGSARPLIPYLKRTGFLGADGAPTALYKSFRNPTEAGAAAAKALRTGYTPLFEMAEAAHTLDDSRLRGLVVQATGLENSSKVVGAILGSFKALRAFADPSGAPSAADPPEPESEAEVGSGETGGALPPGLSLGYTINLHLPATSDVAVFNAIFKSLREHLLR